MPHKDVALKIEHFYNDEDLELRIDSKTEMQSILQSIAELGTHVALYYGHSQNFILTILLGTDEHGMWLDVGPFPPENKLILLSDKISFVSVHQHVKIQFVVHHIKSDLFENKEAFYMEMPDYLLRIQRREFYRAPIPVTAPVKCIIPIQPGNPDDPVIMREVPLADISGGGIGLLCGENEVELSPNKIFTGCHISLPDIGILTVVIEVRNGINFATHNNVVHKHVGCRFIRSDNQIDNIEMDNLLQRYIIRLQHESLILAPPNDK
jgi:c-di-GMP-binding flagellar brake protein YcgR